MQLRKILAISLLSLASAAFAQTATVSGTVTGADGCVYANGTYNFNMTDSNGNDLTPGSIIYIGPIPTYVRNVQGTLNGFGAFSVSLLSNNALVSPVGTKWKFSINSQNPQGNAGNIPPQQSFKYTTTIVGNVDLSATLTALAPPLGCHTGGGGGGIPPAGPAYTVQFSNSVVSGFNADPTITIDPTSHTLAAQKVNSSVNTQINVTAYPYLAKGDGTTDDQAAINAACTTARSFGSSPAQVYFPKTATGSCYLTSTLTQCTGVSLKGQPSMGQVIGKGGVCIKSQPGQDIINGADPNVAGYAPSQSWDISDLFFYVDDTVSTTGLFPHRWPGRWTQDGAINSGSAVLTSPKSQFTCSDVGQPIQVNGAGAAGANLVTTISSIKPCSVGSANVVTLAATASTSVSNAYVYTSVNNIPVTTNIGNCAMGFDNHDGNYSNWLVNLGLPEYPTMHNITIESVSTGIQNNSCGIYFQGQWTPYGLDAQQVNILRTVYGIVEGTTDTNPASGNAGQDFQKWAHMLFQNTYPWISYNGGDNDLEGWQLASPYGPVISQTTTGVESGAFNWRINIPEFEQGSSGGFVIKGQGHHVVNTALNAGKTVFIDANALTCTACIINGTLQLDGAGNRIEIASPANAIFLPSVVDNGNNNLVTGVVSSSPLFGNQPTRTTAMNITKTPGYSGSRTPDFLLTNNGTTPFFNQQDLLFFPKDYEINANPYAIVADSNSFSGYYMAITSTNGTSGFTTFALNPSPNFNNAVISNSPAGGQIPATIVTIWDTAKCPVDTSYSLEVRAGSTTVANVGLPCTTTYTTNSFQVDLSAYSGQFFNFTWVVTHEVDDAWSAVVPTTAFVPGGSSLLRNLICANTSSTCMLASDWYWGNGVPTIIDSTSPVGYSTSLFNSWHLTTWKGDSNNNAGHWYPAVNSNISLLLQSPPVITDTLGADQTSGATTVTVSNAQAAWGATGCLLVDQEIECYSGSAAVSATTYTVTRGQYGTLAQAHTSGTTYYSTATAQFNAICNSVAVINTFPVIATPTWTFTSIPYPAQNCSGYATALSFSGINGVIPTGQSFKIAAIDITPQPNAGITNPMTTLGDTVYGGAAGILTRLAGSTSASTLCLTQTGTGSVSAAPVWGACSGSTATAFSAITSATNTSAAMLVGTGASFGPTGTGTVTANQISGCSTLGLATSTGAGVLGCEAVPTWNQNTTGTASNVSGTPALPNGTTATTQSAGDNSTKLATTAYIDTGFAKEICHGTVTLSTGAISAGQKVQNTATCTNAVVGDNVMVDWQGTDPDGLTGYDASAGYTLLLNKKVSATNTVDVEQVNSINNPASITPSSVTLVFRVVR